MNNYYNFKWTLKLTPGLFQGQIEKKSKKCHLNISFKKC